MSISAPAPHDREAESWVIGSVLKSETAMAHAQWLRPADFYDAKYGAIWRAMLDLWERAVPISLVTLAERLKSPDLARSGVGFLELGEIDYGIPTAAHVEHYARIVANYATRRRYIQQAQAIAEAAYKPGCDVDELVTQADGFLAKARPSESRKDLLRPEQFAQILTDDLTMREQGLRTSITTGLVDIDDMTLGLEAGRLVLLMATPGSGKSELAKQIAVHVALSHGPVLFASLEMTSVEVGHRYVRITRGVDRNRLAITAGPNGLTPEDWESIAAALEEIGNGRLWVASPRGAYTTSDLRADAMEVQASQGKPALIVADYLQRFSDSAGKFANREQNVGLIAQNLKSLAREFGCPVLAPVQPNRDHRNRPSNPRPVLTDLRESGRLEAEADMVLGLYRDEKHHPDTRDRGIMEVWMLKNRTGVGDTSGCRKLVWRGHRYDNYAPLPTGAMVA